MRERVVLGGQMPCLKPDCRHIARSRGLCNGCLTAASQLIEAGETTEEELIAHGKMLPKQRNAKLWLVDFKKTG